MGSGDFDHLVCNGILWGGTTPLIDGPRHSTLSSPLGNGGDDGRVEVGLRRREVGSGSMSRHDSEPGNKGHIIVYIYIYIRIYHYV